MIELSLSGLLYILDMYQKLPGNILWWSWTRYQWWPKVNIWVFMIEKYCWLKQRHQGKFCSSQLVLNNVGYQHCTLLMSLWTLTFKKFDWFPVFSLGNTAGKTWLVRSGGSVAEWSKALDLGSSLYGGVGSNPTTASFTSWYLLFLAMYWAGRCEKSSEWRSVKVTSGYGLRVHSVEGDEFPS